MTAFAGTKFLPVLAHNPDGNYRARMTTYNLPHGLQIVPCMVHDFEFESICIFEVRVDFIHIADAASLESALALLSDKYTSSLPF